MTQQPSRRAALSAIALAVILVAAGCAHKPAATPADRATTAPPPAPAPSPTVPPAVVFDCGEGRTIILKMTTDPNEVWLWLPDRSHKLIRKVAESGRMWSNGNITFWEQGEQATLRVLDQPTWTCLRMKK